MAKMPHGFSAFIFPFTTAGEIGEQFRQLRTSQPRRYDHTEAEAQIPSEEALLGSVVLALQPAVRKRQQERRELG